MDCPRCGTPNEPGDRFCSSCGSALGKAPPPRGRRSLREQLGRVVGTTPKARMASAATAVALIVAVAAFVALDPADDTSARDAYTASADRICLQAKRGIIATERKAGEAPGAVDVAALAEGLLPIVGSWRTKFQQLNVPADRAEDARRLEDALLEAEIRIGGLARVASDGDQGKTVASAKQADAASTEVEEAVAALDLSQCAQARIGLTATPG